MPQLRIRARFRVAFGLRACLIGIAALVAIGCRAVSSRTTATVQSSGPVKPVVSSGGPFKRIGVPAAGMGYINPIFSGDSRRFIARNEHAANENVRLWDVTLKPLCDPLPDTGPDYGLTFNGKIAFTTDDKSIRFWDVDASKLIRATKITDGELTHVAISPDGSRFLAIVNGEKAVEVWRTGGARPRLLIKQDAVDAAFDPTGTRIVINCGGAMRIFLAETGKEACPRISFSSHYLPELAELFDSTGRQLLLRDLDAFKVVDTTTGKVRFRVVLEEFLADNEDTESVRWSADYSRISATLFSPHPARIYDVATGRLERTVGTNVGECWVGPGAHWAIGFCSKVSAPFAVWDLPSGRLVQSLKLDGSAVSPDCSTIVTGREDGLDAIWRMQPD